jgi:predicted dehydrogenase/threonine dehydrogenase-like Zn-dependent dehydrogenase
MVMKQLTQRLKDGAMQVLEVPPPALGSGMVLVRNHYSLISAGTEASTVKAARKGYLGKAKERPEQVKQVLGVLKTQGVVQTYRAVMKKLDAFSPLGYSCAGQVIEVAEGVSDFQNGDFVACGGLTASHGEIVAVPVNLCVKLHPETDMQQAAFNSLGAIALQGIRQAELQLGETCAVIGLGLLGQLTCVLLRAAGIRVVGIDLDPNVVDLAKEKAADLAFLRSEAGLESRIIDFTGGVGCDAVIITAASDSSDPINFAGALARKRARIVVVGAVPTGFDREPHYYKKELQVRMACSYGPGRYDPEYEEKGRDYPVGYVRWTERRNMQAFQDFIKTGKIDIRYLITHTFSLNDAPKAYDMMMERQEPYIGLLVEYDHEAGPPLVRAPVVLRHSTEKAGADRLVIGFIGAGSYAQGNLLPNLPSDQNQAVRKCVATTSGASARTAADRFGFQACTTQADDIIGDHEINTVFIATRHDSHGPYVLQALKAGKNVFVEKPLCLTEAELQEIRNVYEQAGQEDPQNVPVLMVGYNRRFAPLTRKIKDLFGQGPLSSVFRINAGAIPADSWIQDPETGGGRILGEVCHFVDYLIHLCGRPVSVYGAAMSDPKNLNDSLNAVLRFGQGSIGTVAYLSQGDKAMAKEKLEVFGLGMSAVLDDFRRLTIYQRGRQKIHKLTGQDKGQKSCVSEFLQAVRSGGASPIPFDELYYSSLVTFKILESLETRTVVPF